MSSSIPERRQSKKLLKLDERGSKIARNSVWRQMTIETVSNDFDLCLWIVLTFSIAAYPA